MNGSLRGRVAIAAGLAVHGLVAGGGDDDDAREPELLDGLVERVASGSSSASPSAARSSRRGCCTASLVLEDPLGGRDHVARARHALVVHHVQRDDPRGGCRARVVGRRAGGQAGDGGAVAVAVAGRVARERVRLSCARTRSPKSARLGSMPESTKAIEGVRRTRGPWPPVLPGRARAGDRPPLADFSPELNARSRRELPLRLAAPGASRTTGCSGVITRPGLRRELRQLARD